MFRKLFLLILCFFTLSASAGTEEKIIKTYIQKQYFKSRKTPLTLQKDNSIPFASSHIFRVRDISSHRGWTMWADESGRVVEVNTRELRTFFKSISQGLGRMKFSKKKGEAVRISNALLNHLGTSRKEVICKEEPERTICQLSFTEGPFASQKTVLKFDFKQGYILAN